MVEIIRLSFQPITTPEYPDPTPIAREVRWGNRTATLYLEDAAWNALCRIACQQGRSVDALCADIDNATAPGASFAQAARYLSLTTSPRQFPTGCCRPNFATSADTVIPEASNNSRQ
jgi:predicted DNA-binding ribbon-helix-helix protein